MKKNKSKKSWILALCIFIAGIGSGAAVNYLIGRIFDTYAESAPYNSLSEHIMHKTTKGHLWFEEYMSGDTSINYETDVKVLIISARDVLRKSIEGGDTECGYFHANEDLEMVAMLEETDKKMIEFISVLDKRNEKKMEEATVQISDSSATKETLIGDAMDQEFDRLYEAIQTDMQQLKTFVNDKNSEVYDQINLIKILILSLMVVVALGLGIFVYRFSNENEQLLDSVKDKQAELEVRMQQVDTACIVSETDAHGNIVYANDKFCEVAKYSREELIGKPQNIVRHPDTPKAVFREMWETIKAGKIFRSTLKNRAKDGSPYYVDAIIAPVMGQDGKPHKYIGIRYDITETTLKQQRMEGILGAINSSFAFIEFDTNGIVQDANDIFLQTLGYTTISEVKGKHHRIFVNDEYASTSAYKRFWEELNNGIFQKGDFKRISRNGKTVWIQAVYAPVKDELGRIYKIVKIATDITTQKQVLINIQNLVEVAGKDGKLNERLTINNNTDEDMSDLINSVNQLMDSISLPLLEIGKVINQMSQGNLTERLNLTVKGDIKNMGDALNTAMNNLNKLLGNINQMANLVAASSEELLAKGEQMKSTTQEVASATQQMAEGAQQQAEQTDESSKLIDGVLKSANEMGKKAEIITSAAEDVQKKSAEGLSTIRKVVQNMNEIQESANVTSHSIGILTQRSEEIARTLNVITDIASQTNLLALNAAIEAARAGDAGRGFAVVAEEIRKLAEDSRKSAVDIEKVIREVQKDINSASKSIESMESSVKSGNHASKEAEIVFDSISTSSIENYKLSKEIVESTTKQKDSINNTVKNIEKIVVVSEETASGTEQIASSTKELSQGMNEVTSTSKDLADVANQLLEGVSKFKLS